MQYNSPSLVSEKDIDFKDMNTGKSRSCTIAGIPAMYCSKTNFTQIFTKPHPAIKINNTVSRSFKQLIMK